MSGEWLRSPAEGPGSPDRFPCPLEQQMPLTRGIEAPLTDDALICGFQIPATGPPQPVSVTNVRSALDAAGAVTWLHFRLSDARVEPFLLESGLFPAALRQALAERDSHTRVEDVEGGLMVVVTDFSFEHTDDTSEMARLWGYATARSFVSARMHALHSVDALRHDVHEPVVNDHLQLDIRVRRQKAGQNRHEYGSHGMLGRGDTERA